MIFDIEGTCKSTAITVIILMDNDGKIDELLIQCGFELMDVLKKDEERSLLLIK